MRGRSTAHFKLNFTLLTLLVLNKRYTSDSTQEHKNVHYNADET